MARRCDLSGKGPQTGNNVSHSQKKTKRRWLPNVQKRKLYIPELGRTVRLKVSARALRTIDKKGITAYLKDEGLTINDIT